VDPFLYYAGEPAPMGVVDIGETVTGQPYHYNTSGLLGTVRVDRLSAFNRSLGSGTVSFQLNGVLVIAQGSRQLTYWVQNVVMLDTTTGGVSFSDNVWNFSQRAASVTWPWLVGNGTTVGCYDGSDRCYDDTADPRLPGAAVTLRDPVAVAVDLRASTVNRTPAVEFQYDDGFGWQTFDTAVFRYAHGWTSQGFWVNGSLYTPNDLYYDAEWVYGGQGNGSSTTNLRSDLTLGLDFWNGHNFQGVLNAWNFGSDTGETVGNVSETDTLDGPGDAPAAVVTAGPGGIGPLYNRSYVSVLTVNSTVSSGNVSVDGTMTPFVGGQAILTLGAGRYEISLSNGSATLAARNVTLLAGGSLFVDLSPPIPPTTAAFPVLDEALAVGLVAVIAVGVAFLLVGPGRRRRVPDAPPPAASIPLPPPPGAPIALPPPPGRTRPPVSEDGEHAAEDHGE
jgi:hypothetical protein